MGYVIRKLNQVRENVPSSQSRFEAIEIVEAVILALVSIKTATPPASSCTVTFGRDDCLAVGD
jgi:hypothetical protein